MLSTLVLQRDCSLVGHISNNNRSRLLPENVTSFWLTITHEILCLLQLIFQNCVLSTLNFLNTHFVLLCDYVHVQCI